ncbi:F-box/kelch-repeat protein At3g06240 isoform X2 [Medicago truncatula]|uniref:F-box/kelch-repeat protein At3g06240 isoform X2 n=1 Tax=Medicago truncatula TaxID=3880 RepID=UPI000D2F3FF0|nr:F-box/kelch-repeat protein At3g06240 isoform X2 [Medicago truncatula]
MEKKTGLYLPHELIIQIMLRLPVKSLIRFKCVSLETRSIDFEASLNDDSASTSLNLNFMPPESYSSLEIKSSCRGFIVLTCSSNIYLWNPSTGHHKQIPFPASNLDAKYSCCLYGFGYDHLRDDYLVVSVSYNTSIDPVDDNISSHLKFFSLRANTWNEIECPGFVKYNHFPYYMNANDDPKVGMLFNGTIHWFSFRHDLSMDVIVGFDLVERKLLEMHFPDGFDYEPIDCDLWIFGEFLSLWAMEDGTVEIWVMKEYKVHSSWVKTLVLSIDDISIEYYPPICSTKSGGIIGTNGGGELVKYDGNGQLLENRSYFNDPCALVVMYTESLLSLPGDSGQF